MSRDDFDGGMIFVDLLHQKKRALPGIAHADCGPELTSPNRYGKAHHHRPDATPAQHQLAHPIPGTHQIPGKSSRPRTISRAASRATVGTVTDGDLMGCSASSPSPRAGMSRLVRRSRWMRIASESSLKKRT